MYLCFITEFSENDSDLLWQGEVPLPPNTFCGWWGGGHRIMVAGRPRGCWEHSAVALWQAAKSNF